MALIVVGSANMDMVVHSPRFPAPGETLIGTTFETFPGGKGANQAVAAAKLGADVRFVGQVGDDAFGAMLRASLANAGADTSRLLTHPDLPTGIAAITIDDSGQNTIIVAPGANSAVTASQALAVISDTDMVLLQLEIPVDEVFAILMGSKATMILNPAPAAPIPDSIYPRIAIITPNESEATALTGIAVMDAATAKDAAEWFLAKGVQQVVITLGERGALCHGDSLSEHLGAWPVEAIDTVGAGDAFSGALAAFLVQGKDFRTAAKLAGIAAAISTTRPGAQASMPKLAEVLSNFN